jgi:hypothetical protein
MLGLPLTTLVGSVVDRGDILVAGLTFHVDSRSCLSVDRTGERARMTCHAVLYKPAVDVCANMVELVCV